jgi:DNA-binding CsgD family transcriptional regulator
MSSGRSRPAHRAPITLVMATITSIPGERRSGRGSDALLERERELAVLEHCLDDAARGAGGMVYLEAPAGGGKSRLLGAARELALEARLRVLTAAGVELEREFPFGLAIQLFEPLSRDAHADELVQLPLALTAAVLHDDRAGEPTVPAARQYSVIHSLFRATQNLAGLSTEDEAEWLAILIDDLHWADRVSLRFLIYLAERVTELPIAIVLAAAPGQPSADPQALATLRRAAAGRLLSPAPLGADGVTRVVRTRFPRADAEFCAASALASGGNPFLLQELLAAVAEYEEAPSAAHATWLGRIVPGGVRDLVAARLDSMPRATRAVAEAVAVLGESASVQRIARLAELDSETVLTAADQLAAMRLLAPGISPAFAQPMFGAAVEASLAPYERAQAHLRAARMLAEQDAGAELIARHLLEAPADDDPAAADVLREAADAALERAEPERAARLLVRALAEQPADPGRRAELALAQGQALSARGEFRAAADALHAGLAELDGDGELGVELSAAYTAAAALVGELGTEALATRDRMIERHAVAEGLPPPARTAVANTLVLEALHGAPSNRVGDLAELAWNGGALLESRDTAPFSVPLLATGLVISDDLERALEICDAALDAGCDESAQSAHAMLACARSWALYEQGRVGEARVAMDATLERAPSRGELPSPGAVALLARCSIEAGRPQHAESVVAAIERHGSRDPVGWASILDVRAQLRLTQHRAHEALQDALHAGAVLGEQLPDASPGSIAWRSRAALAHLALGEPRQARELVERELEHARSLGVTRIVIRDLRILGLALGGKPHGIKVLGEAVALGRSHPGRLEQVRALIDYGAALRRANRRAQAREPLRLGLDLSHRGGAALLESRARSELIAAGGRPRRPTLVGVDSLTTSQRRVAELAAAGFTNRQIAGALFVTPKTVEFHLRSIYSKLNVTSRDRLAKALEPSATAA